MACGVCTLMLRFVSTGGMQALRECVCCGLGGLHRYAQMCVYWLHASFKGVQLVGITTLASICDGVASVSSCSNSQ
jgi:hypothetical protein